MSPRRIARHEDIGEGEDGVFSDPGKEQPWGCSLQNSTMKACGPLNRSLVGVKPLKYSRREQYLNIAYILYYDTEIYW